MENKLGFKIKTKSPLILSTGKSSSTYIDSEMDFDEYGFPYISAKRFKGVLRDSTKEVLGMLNNLNSASKLISDDLIFGTSCKESLCQLENVRIKDYDESLQQWKHLLSLSSTLPFTRTTLINSISTLRTQTSINQDSGVADDKSLRTIRVLNKGVIFKGDITLLADLKKTKNILILSLLNLRHIGLGRTRGFGEIECTIVDSSTTKSKEDIEKIKSKEDIEKIIGDLITSNGGE